MSLLRTRDIQVGSLLAFTGVDPTDGQASFLWGAASTFSLSKGDVVEVLDVETRTTTTWAKVLVAVVKGKCSGRAGYVSIDLGERVQRSWQGLTISGSVAAMRLRRHQTASKEGLTGKPTSVDSTVVAGPERKGKPR